MRKEEKLLADQRPAAVARTLCWLWGYSVQWEATAERPKPWDQAVAAVYCPCHLMSLLSMQIGCLTDASSVRCDLGISTLPMSRLGIITSHMGCRRRLQGQSPACAHLPHMQAGEAGTLAQGLAWF